MKKITCFSIIYICLFLVGCVTLPPPANPHNLCHIFKSRLSWYKHAQTASKRWNIPVHILMAIMKQESHFVAHAQPKRSWFLFIPLPRSSSAYGYAQAQDRAWNDYKKQAAKSWFPSRSDFGDAIDFIGWYLHKTHKINKVSVLKADLLYLNYHEGWGGYRRGTWKKKQWLMNVAKKVEQNALNYKQQLKQCRLHSVSSGWFW